MNSLAAQSSPDLPAETEQSPDTGTLAVECSERLGANVERRLMRVENPMKYGVTVRLTHGAKTKFLRLKAGETTNWFQAHPEILMKASRGHVNVEFREST